MRILIATVLALAAPFESCARKITAPIGSVEFAIVVPAAASATTLPFKGKDYAIEGERLRVSVVDLSTGHDSDGHPAVDGELADSEKARFGAWTATNIEKSMVIIVGEKIVTLATLKAKLPGKFQISAGPEPFTPQQIETVIADIKKGH